MASKKRGKAKRDQLDKDSGKSCITCVHSNHLLYVTFRSGRTKGFAGLEYTNGGFVRQQPRPTECVECLSAINVHTITCYFTVLCENFNLKVVGDGQEKSQQNIDMNNAPKGGYGIVVKRQLQDKKTKVSKAVGLSLDSLVSVLKRKKCFVGGGEGHEELLRT